MSQNILTPRQKPIVYPDSDGRLREITQMHGWVSPRLAIRFDLADGQLRIFGADNRPFASYVELAAQRDQLRAQLKALGIEPQV